MTKEITKAYILQQIQDKLKLRELEPERFAFSELVVPIYDIEQHLRKFESKHVRSVITGIGGMTVYVVPDNERWFINGYTIVFFTGAYTVAGVYLRRHRTPTVFVYLDLTAAQSVSYTHNLPKVLTLDSGDSLAFNIDGYTSTGSLDMELDCEVEVIR